MAYYFIANIRIKDEKEYNNYLKSVDHVFAKYNGKYLASDNDPVILEGNWNYSRTVVIQFENKNDFENWYYSDEYQKILKHRLTAANCDTILIKGNS
ncbi:MAG: DUF1330 domain-containing protein [Melioribacteraceae bacterium]|nr:MAG: DUF1330 domain-containing protein [Melioribacteraceae bacterium]